MSADRPLPSTLQAAIQHQPLGVIVIDHGSRRPESNQLLLDVARAFQQITGHAIVEPAHMELAEPTLSQAFRRCVEQGARFVVIFPYFLGPGRHWEQDIPALAAAAAVEHAGIPYLVTAPLGLHAKLIEVMAERVQHCLDQAGSGGNRCSVCEHGAPCEIRPAR